jgi:phasin family protein
MVTKAKIEKPALPLESVVEVGKQTVESLMKTSAEVATKNYEKTFAAAQEQLEKAASAAAQGYEEFTAFGKDNMDVMVKASTLLVKGFEDLGKEVATYGQASVERSVTNLQAMFGIKTLRELIDLQTEQTKETFDSLIEEGTKIGEMSTKVANEAFGPIQAQVSAAVEKLLKPLAA